MSFCPQETLPLGLALAKTIGIIAPALYTGITFSYSEITIKPLLTHATPKLLAKQWLQAYQYGPVFVPPLIIGGVVCNGVLAYFALTPIARSLYIFAAVTSWVIIPVTLLYMEPGVNGATKWKAHLLIKEDGHKMEDNDKRMPDVYKHTATQASRRWAEKTEMKSLVERWGYINGWRWVVVGLGTVASAVASHVDNWGRLQ